MLETFEFAIPVPPSVNNLYLNLPGRGRMKTSNYKRWVNDAGWRLKLKMGTDKRRFQAGYSVVLVLPKNMRGDIDNRMKPVSDLMVNIGLTVDDRFAAETRQMRAETDDGEARVIVTGERTAALAKKEPRHAR